MDAAASAADAAAAVPHTRLPLPDAPYRVPGAAGRPGPPPTGAASVLRVGRGMAAEKVNAGAELADTAADWGGGSGDRHGRVIPTALAAANGPGRATGVGGSGLVLVPRVVELLPGLPSVLPTSQS